MPTTDELEVMINSLKEQFDQEIYTTREEIRILNQEKDNQIREKDDQIRELKKEIEVLQQEFNEAIAIQDRARIEDQNQVTEIKNKVTDIEARTKRIFYRGTSTIIETTDITDEEDRDENRRFYAFQPDNFVIYDKGKAVFNTNPLESH